MHFFNHSLCTWVLFPTMANHHSRGFHPTGSEISQVSSEGGLDVWIYGVTWQNGMSCVDVFCLVFLEKVVVACGKYYAIIYLYICTYE